MMAAGNQTGAILLTFETEGRSIFKQPYALCLRLELLLALTNSTLASDRNAPHPVPAAFVTDL